MHIFNDFSLMDFKLINMKLDVYLIVLIEKYM